MNTFAERLRLAMAGPPKIKQVDLAAACGIKPPSVSDWLNGRSVNIEGKNLLAASKLLNIRPEWLTTGRGPMRPSDNESNVEPGPDVRWKVPLISWVQAGVFSESMDLLYPGDAESWHDCPREHSHKTYALRIRGESMAPRFQPGEIIMVDPEVPADNGRFVIAKKTNSNEATFKQLVVEGNESYLKAINPQWPEPIIRLTEEWIICGVVICKVEIF